MSIVYDRHGVIVHHGDAMAVLRTLPNDFVHAVVTDPPYGLEFMGKEWDTFGTGDGFRRHRNSADAGRDNLFGRASRTSPECFAGTTFQWWCQEWATECLRVLKPGGHLLAFGGTRTHHRLAVGIEDAGFEIRDSITWLYGQGFPKSRDISKEIDRMAGAEREVVGTKRLSGNALVPSSIKGGTYGVNVGVAPAGEVPITAPSTDAARRWSGWGTALKPASEPIVVARRPFSDTVAANVLTHGTGALHVDATRVHSAGSEGRAYTVKRLKPGATLAKTGGSWRPEDGEHLPWEPGREYEGCTQDGRWPTNVVLDEHAAAELDSQSGVMRPSARIATREYAKHEDVYSDMAATPAGRTWGHTDFGGASRFFPTFRWEAKAPSAERPRINGNAHPTVKPLELMRWLVRLVTPPGGTVLDCFAGTGTTGHAARAEGFRAVLVERDEQYLPLIISRLDSYRDTPAVDPATGEKKPVDLLDLLDLLDDGEAS